MLLDPFANPKFLKLYFDYMYYYQGGWWAWKFVSTNIDRFIVLFLLRNVMFAMSHCFIPFERCYVRHVASIKRRPCCLLLLPIRDSIGYLERKVGVFVDQPAEGLPGHPRQTFVLEVPAIKALRFQDGSICCSKWERIVLRVIVSKCCFFVQPYMW